MKKKIIFTLVFVVILSAVAISAITLFDFFDNNYVFKINDMKISPSEIFMNKKNSLRKKAEPIFGKPILTAFPQKTLQNKMQ